MPPRDYHLTSTRPARSVWLVLLTITSLFLLGWYLSFRYGAVTYSHADLLEVLRNPLTDSPKQDIIIDIRLPRMVAALLVGSAMALSGLIMQGITRNPIADPGLLGINSGAGLALIIAYALISNLHYKTILLVCLLGSILAAILIFSLAYQPGKGYNQLRLILSGAMVATLFNALGQTLTLYFNLSNAVIGWQAGGLVETNWTMVRFIAPFILAGTLIAQIFAHQLTILSLNETVSRALGQKTLVMTLSLLGVVLLLSASAVALIGSISFVGLIIPHFVKMFVPRNYRLIIPLTAFAGATFLLWVDLSSRTFNPPYETPLNAIISIIGLPCFLWLIRKGGHL